MGFFDLNIPYVESDKHIPDKPARKTTRLKLIVKAMELGYTGVAYNRTIKGVMSELDRCSISLFPLSSLLKLAPSLSASVKLHRDLLNVPLSTPFRQYTRLTVLVDSPAQALALNSGNPILKSYDIVAVRPLNQNAFEQSCQASEADLIAIDFSEKLPFRLKQSVVKTAIGRGVYFEITYSGLIMDAQVRRQMISNAKLLVDWTRGKNIIFSSAAPSVTEVRGPNDVANLSSLLGLPMERAKAAISKNCRSLIANALRKKRYHKGAIRVELVSSGEQFDSKEPWFGDWLKWDPISSGEGDLLLDDMAKSFCASSKVSKTVKAIDFASVVDSLPSHGLQVKDFLSVTKPASQPLDIDQNLSAAEETQISIFEESKKLFSPTDTLKDFTKAEEIINHSTMTEEPKSLNGLEAYFAPTGIELHDLQSQHCRASYEANVMLACDNAKFQSLANDTDMVTACKNTVADAEISTLSKDVKFSAFQSDESERPSSLDVVFAAQNAAMDELLTDTEIKNKELYLASCETSLDEGSSEREQLRETRDDSAVTLADGLPVEGSHDKMKDNNDHSVTNYELVNELPMDEQKQTKDHTELNSPVLVESVSGKSRVKYRTTRRSLLFPFKRVLNPVPFKRKARKFKSKIKML
ncbi:hypothetical protein F0562_021852 [Nyssa sinensis]|uniref:Uncharacterized protein n=1 Tax=Nyssa sinensis TaxID=561372 RepID=A0A5J5BS03_9ASTE|nr:hypothetical protein F0562_021852 [Nyssa sinensis]